MMLLHKYFQYCLGKVNISIILRKIPMYVLFVIHLKGSKTHNQIVELPIHPKNEEICLTSIGFTSFSIFNTQRFHFSTFDLQSFQEFWQRLCSLVTKSFLVLFFTSESSEHYQSKVETIFYNNWIRINGKFNSRQLYCGNLIL